MRNFCGIAECGLLRNAECGLEDDLFGLLIRNPKSAFRDYAFRNRKLILERLLDGFDVLLEAALNVGHDKLELL